MTLIDAGLSPRRTGRLLQELGIQPYEVDEIVLTHLDTDHCHAGWPSALRSMNWNATLHVHRRHRGRAERAGLLFTPTELFEDGFALGPRVHVHPTLMAHDELGVAIFRFEIQREGINRPAQLGFATDLGRATADMVAHLAGVDTLAIESNYCPELQASSDRPAFLKQRITGGAGHLSNHETMAAIEQIAPRDHVVLLHLSRECNRPGLVGELHHGAEYAFTVSEQTRPTRWIWIRPSDHEPTRAATPAVTTRVVATQHSLFGAPERR